LEKETMDSAYSPKYPVLTLEKSLDIIDILSKDTGNGLGISELSRKLNDMGKSTIHRILDTLIAYGYVEKEPSRGLYRLSWKIYEIGNMVPHQRHMGNVDAEIMQNLSDKYQETVNFGVRVQNDVVILYKFESRAVLMANMNVGGREPLHATSLGKVLLCEMDANAIRKIHEGKQLKALTANTITDLEKLIIELEKIKKQGYAVDNQEFCEGLSCIATPVRDCKNEIVAALSLSGPSARMNHRKIMDAKKELQYVSQKLAEHFGHVHLDE